ncbi:hypothetical protein AVEN_109800-1 [Araneus ventricosus]|uniref:Uncharacterized protein n=1 Tax=Araneus ventricosus TaxID=182803 RepID=A0A4Y2KHT9_ARAVE|nr:hypothetical protein AVEN_109800-1 [Araneus ventricosus]
MDSPSVNLKTYISYHAFFLKTNPESGSDIRIQQRGGKIKPEWEIGKLSLDMVNRSHLDWPRYKDPPDMVDIRTLCRMKSVLKHLVGKGKTRRIL